MEGLVGILLTLALVLISSGPLAVILVIVLFKKFGSLENRLTRLEGKAQTGPSGVVPAKLSEAVRTEPAWSGRGVTFTPVSSTPEPVNMETAGTSQPKPPVQEIPSEAKPQYAELRNLIENQREELKTQPAIPSIPIPPAPSVLQKEPLAAMTAAGPAVSQTPPRQYFPVPPAPRPAQPGGLELKIGTRVILIAGIITVIFGVGFFLKYVYDKGYFSPAARVALVAVGGLAGVVIGEVLRRRNFEVVAKGITALGFALLYAAVFGGTRVYGLFSAEWAFVFSILVTATAMAYAVILDELLIAFLSLLGGYLAPVIISTGQNLPVPLFTYVLALSAGAMGCAMFRRWRAVNWIAMTGTWLLYTAWFEHNYTSDQLAVALLWLCIFACLYLLLPILYGLVRQIEARAEDVVLVVVNSIAVFYYSWRILSPGDQKSLALATGLLGTAHLAVMFAVLWRCRGDVKLQVSLGILGTAFVTAALPMYFELQAALTGWTIEAVAMTFIGIRYRSLWTQVMAFLVSGVSVAGLFYHLPLHPEGDFSVFLNAPFGTWLFVSAGLLACHSFWRFLRPSQTDEKEASFAAQVFYAAGALLLAVGLALEWHAHCSIHMVYSTVGQAWFLKGMMMVAVLLIPAFLARPLSPVGDIVRNVGAAAAVFGAVFFAIAMMGVYTQAFTLFINLPFGLALGFMAALFWAAWQFKQTHETSEIQRQLSSTLVFLGVFFFFIVLTEQMYLYWSCRHECTDYVGDWRSNAIRCVLITWAVYGLLLLAVGIRFKKTCILSLAFFVTSLSAAGLFFLLPLHRNADFQLAYNPPFITWAVVAAAILTGHGLLCFMRQPDVKDAGWITQFYYTAGLILLALGAGLEWAEHCRWHLQPANAAQLHLHLGLILLLAVTVQGFLARPMSPTGSLVTAAGVLTALGGGVYTAYAMLEVYYTPFALFANGPFAFATLFVIGMLMGAWMMRRTAPSGQEGRLLPAAIIFSALVLTWILLSEQVYLFWYCKNTYGPAPIANWKFSAQMYMSVTWAVYAAVLMIIGFAVRTAGIRWLSLAIFAVLLGKIFIIDSATLRPDYRIGAFITTGVILVGVSFLYQLLKNKGFFEAHEKSKKAAIDDK
jgi:uncharacterized membrane protein